MTTIREWANKYNGNFSDKIKAMQACAKELKLQYKSVVNQYSKAHLWKEIPTLPSQKKGHTLAEFKAEFDKNTYIPKKIKEALKELGDAWEYEHEFTKRSGVSYTDLNLFRPEFDDHFVFIKKEAKKIWCGTKSMANQLKELIS